MKGIVIMLVVAMIILAGCGMQKGGLVGTSITTFNNTKTNELINITANTTVTRYLAVDMRYTVRSAFINITTKTPTFP